MSHSARRHMLSYARSQARLKRLAREARGNTRVGTPDEAARQANVLLLAVHWSQIDEVLNQAGDLSAKVIVSCSLPMNVDDTELIVVHISSGAEELAKKVPGLQLWPSTSLPTTRPYLARSR